MATYIPWLCPRCFRRNFTEMHAENAHYISMICDNCGWEGEGCYCDNNIITERQMMARLLGGAKSEKKAEAARRNGRLGGRPKKLKN